MTEKNHEQKQIFSLTSMKMEPGEKIHGFLQTVNGRFELPAAVICGKKPGKTVLIMAGVHAGEYAGIEAALELAAELEPEKVCGRIVVLKTISRENFEKRGGTLNLEDGKNLNREFPGDKEGTATQKLAYAIGTEIFPYVDYCIDLHGGAEYERLTPHVYYAGKAEEGITAISRKMAEQVDVPYMVRSMMTTGGAYNYAASLGIPSILMERGGMGTWTEEEVKSIKRDVKNILCAFQIYEGKRDYRKYYPLDVTDICYQSAFEAGFWYPQKIPGDMVTGGEILGYIKDYEGNILETCRAEFDGVVLYQTESLQVTEEGSVIAYGRIVRNYDDRKERITGYWSKRSESYIGQKRRELKNEHFDKWTQEIRKRIPDHKKLKVLDVGCGSGFFSVLLAKEGHEVTGIDLTPEMVVNSKILAKEEGVSCRFFVMDAEKPEFDDETFDLVISRNLTWTLPHVKEAYSEWKRVLKKDGILLNFDANYGNADFTESKEEDSEVFDVGDEMARECEAIKRQLPVSSYMRPAWDVEVLGQLGFEELSIDLGLGKRIYKEKDEFYNPVPMFAVCAVKRTNS